VLWHQYENKKDFLPRLGGQITRISTTEDDSLFIVSLRDNSVKLIKAANFALHSQISSLTDPLIYNTSLTTEERNTGKTKFFNTGVIQHPSNGLIVLNSAPGKIQFYDYFERSKLKEFAVIARNTTSRVREVQPEAQEVHHISFDSTGKYFVAAVQRSSGSEITSFSSLIFHDETSVLAYTVNTRVEYPHGRSVGGLISFNKQGEEEGNIYYT
jgi:hypothetical protein